MTVVLHKLKQNDSSYWTDYIKNATIFFPHKPKVPSPLTGRSNLYKTQHNCDFTHILYNYCLEFQSNMTHSLLKYRIYSRTGYCTRVNKSELPSYRDEIFISFIFQLLLPNRIFYKLPFCHLTISAFLSSTENFCVLHQQL